MTLDRRRADYSRQDGLALSSRNGYLTAGSAGARVYLT